MYTTCDDGGGGGTDPDPDPEPESSLSGEACNDDVSETAMIETTVDSVQYRQSFATWQFAKAVSVVGNKSTYFYGHSVDILKTKKVGANWEWVSCTNSSISMSGMRLPNHTIVVDGWVANLTPEEAKVEIAWHTEITGNISHGTIPIVSYKTHIKPQ